MTVSELPQDGLPPTDDSLPRPIPEMPKQGPEKAQPEPDPVPPPTPISKEKAVAVMHTSILNFCRMLGLSHIR